MHGVLVVDKPAGPTSHDVVDKVRKVLGERRVGHTGTLDPFATGVLAVCVGKATRLARFLAEGDKVYRATARLGFATTTDDLLGEPLGPVHGGRFELASVREACRKLTGELLQVPPAYSAKRVEGHRLYYLARKGVAVERPPSRVTVHSLDVLGVAGDRVEIDVRCSQGTYVRALARDLGEALGVGGHLVALRRTRSGGFDLEGAVSWVELPRVARERVLSMSQVLLDLPAARVGPEGVEAIRHGRDLSHELVSSGFPEVPPPRLRVLDAAGSLVALAVPRGFGYDSQGLTVEPVLHPDVVLLD